MAKMLSDGFIRLCPLSAGQFLIYCLKQYKITIKKTKNDCNKFSMLIKYYFEINFERKFLFVKIRPNL